MKGLEGKHAVRHARYEILTTASSKERRRERRRRGDTKDGLKTSVQLGLSVVRRPSIVHSKLLQSNNSNRRTPLGPFPKEVTREMCNDAKTES